MPPPSPTLTIIFMYLEVSTPANHNTVETYTVISKANPVFVIAVSNIGRFSKLIKTLFSKLIVITSTRLLSYCFKL